MKIRPATLKDFRQFYGRESPVTLRGIVAEREGGHIVGFGGYYLVGSMAYAFTDQTGMTKREIVQAGREVVKMLKGLNLDIAAACTESDVALRHFGFEPFGDFYKLAR